jgi:hypothetical protein
MKISDLKNPQKISGKVGGKKIEMGLIVQAIVSSNLYYSVKEIWTGENLMNKQVGRVRAMALLNGAATVGYLDRQYSDGKFFYGPGKIPFPAEKMPKGKE